jgi:hypothetical protein
VVWIYALWAMLALGSVLVLVGVIDEIDRYVTRKGRDES